MPFVTTASLSRPTAARPVLSSLPGLTRSRWLANLLHAMRPEIRRLTGLRVPLVKVSADGVVLRGRDVRGSCNHVRRGIWSATLNIAPDLTDARQIAATLAHEALHAALPHAGHDWTFQEAANRIGLKPVGDRGGTESSPAFDAWAGPLLDRLPAYPAATPAPVAVSYPLPWSRLYLAACVAAAGASAALLPFGDTVGKALRVMGGPVGAITGPTAFIVPGALIALGLTDCALSGWARVRNVLRVAIVAAPVGVGLWSWWMLSTSPAALADLQAWIAARLAAQDYGWAVPIDAPAKLATEGAFYAASRAALFFSLPVALALWITRPVVSYYRLGRLKALTPPFLWSVRQGVPGDPNAIRERTRAPDDKTPHREPSATTPPRWFSRSNPAHVGRLMASIAEAARVERALIGLPIAHPDGQAIEPYLLPASGFVIEEYGDGTALVACGLSRLLHRAEVERLAAAGVRFNTTRRDRRAVEAEPLYRAATIRVRLADAIAKSDPLAPPSTEKGGARFAWPL